MSSLCARLATHAAGPSADPARRIDALDGWRGIAIAMVLADHFLSFHLINVGRVGVEMFFVLSGILIGHILFVEKVSVSRFFKRRCSRVGPVFVVFVAATFSLALANGWEFSGAEVLTTSTFLRTYTPVPPTIWDSPLPIGHFWTLSVQIHVYLVLGFLAACCSTGRLRLVLFALAFATLAAIGYYAKIADPRPADYVLRSECAATGLFLSAGYSLVRDRWAPRIRGWMPIAALVVAAACYHGSVRWWVSLSVAPVCLAFAVNHLRELPGLLRSVVEFAPVRLLGMWSYSIYIWQQPFYEFRASLPSGTAFPCAMAASLASFYLLERPARAWLNRRSSSTL